MKKLLAMILASAMVLSLVGCSSSSSSSADEGGNKTIRVSGIDGSITLFPVYLAQEMGWFDEVGLTIDRSGFTNGPVQMEAIDSWDIGVTGAGGVLSGSISYGAVLLGTVGTDDGTQVLFTRQDSAIALAGAGNNTINPEIVGDAESWTGASVNSVYGNVLHYMLIKTLEGFGLTIDDVVVNWMDQPTSNTAFLAGEGDAACTSGVVSFSDDKADYVIASTGPLAEVGLLTNIMANPDSLADDDMRETMKTFLKVFFEATDWITANPEEASVYMKEWCAYAGNEIDDETAYLYTTIDPYYTLEDNYNTMNEAAHDGGDYNRIQEQIVGVLNFFIATDSYQVGDDERFLAEELMDASLINELYEEAQG